MNPAGEGAKALEGEYACCLVQDQEYGVRTSLVRDIIRAPVIRRVPKAPSFIEGVANIGGRIIPILNPMERFGLPKPTQHAYKQVVVIREGDSLYGLLVESVASIAYLSRDVVEPVNPLLVHSEARFISGMARHDEKLLYLLDWNAFLRAGLTLDREAEDRYQAYAARITAFYARPTARKLKRFLALSVGDEHYCLGAAHLREVVPAREIKPAPGGFERLVGVITRGKKMLPIIDLHTKLGLDPVPFTNSSRAAILDVNGRRFGVLVHSAREILTVAEEEIKEAPAVSSGKNAALMEGVAVLEGGKRLFVILDARGILDHEDMERLDRMDELKTPEAEVEDDVRRGKTGIAHLLFKVADMEFALSLKGLSEVIRYREPTRVPKAPGIVKGIISVKGELVSVIDLRKRLGVEARPGRSETLVIIMRLGDSTIGMAVDSVSEIMRVEDDDVSPTPEILKGIDDRLVAGVIRTKDGDRAPMILHVEEVLEGVER